VRAAVLVCGRALSWMSAFQTFCSEWPYAVVCFAIHFWPLLRLLWSLVAWIQPQHSFPVLGNSCHQLSGRQHLFKLFRLVWWMCVHPLLWLLFGINNNEKQMEGVKTWLSSQAYWNLLPDTTSASIPAVTTLRSSLNMYVFLYIIKFFLIVCFVNSSLEVTSGCPEIWR
jgi:hypothetical protein